MDFVKYHGCGNDYIYFDCFSETIGNPGELSIRLSDRHKGIGGDGIVLILPSDAADAKMRMFNNDGSEGKMCGNAIRCVGKYLYDSGRCRKKDLKIETLSGIKTLKLNFEDDVLTSVTVDMGKPVLTPALIPTTLPGDTVINRDIGFYNITAVSMGNPHAVVFVSDVKNFDVAGEGKKLENNPLFPEGVNVEFAEVLSPDTIQMRVLERGSGETMACGTGACATVVAATLNGLVKTGEEITVKLLGGDLHIKYTGETVLMTGEAVEVFRGTVKE